MRNRRVNERTDDEVDLREIVKSYDTRSEYLIVEPGELDDTAPGRSKGLEGYGQDASQRGNELILKP
ncbi:hypothetical protein [Streptomyces sp. NPDC001502]|uniref:hypothetical protein n=1 Tax=Streptomyces sp. NPDC001502 TaxID=3364578 RepID=UPI0036CB7373